MQVGRGLWLVTWLVSLPVLAQEWAVQLSGGSTPVLQAQADGLRDDWPQVRVVLIEGKAKLLVPFASREQAEAALPTLRRTHARAFIRALEEGSRRAAEVPDKAEVAASRRPVPEVVAEPAPAAAPAMRPSGAGRVSALPVPILEEVVSDAPAMGQQRASTAQGGSAWVIQVASGMTVRVEALAERLQRQWPDVRQVLVGKDVKLVLGEWTSYAQAQRQLAAVRAVVPDAFLRQLPTDAVEMVQEPLPREVDSEVPATAGASQQPLMAPSSSAAAASAVVAPVAEAPLSGAVVVAGEAGALPVQRLSTVVVAHAAPGRGVELQEAVRWMLSPLYLQPDGEGAGRLAMSRVIKALMSAANLSAKQDKARLQLFSQLADKVGQGDWSQALQLSEQAGQWSAEELTSVEQLLLGWVMLQNHRLEGAARHFEASLRKQPGDDARFGLALVHLLRGDDQALVSVLGQLVPGDQKRFVETSWQGVRS